MKKDKKEKSQTTISEVYDIPTKLLVDMRFLKKVLFETVNVINMTYLAGAWFKYDGNCKKVNKGMSGLLMIKESHIGLHAFPYRNYMKFLVSSCKKFSKNDLNRFLKRKFQTDNIETKTMYTGIHI